MWKLQNPDAEYHTREKERKRKKEEETGGSGSTREPATIASTQKRVAQRCRTVGKSLHATPTTHIPKSTHTFSLFHTSSTSCLHCTHNTSWKTSRVRSERSASTKHSMNKTAKIHEKRLPVKFLEDLLPLGARPTTDRMPIAPGARYELTRGYLEIGCGIFPPFRRYPPKNSDRHGNYQTTLTRAEHRTWDWVWQSPQIRKPRESSANTVLPHTSQQKPWDIFL